MIAPTIPTRFRDNLEVLRWSRRGLAEALGCDDRLVRRWASGEARIPDDVGAWLADLAAYHKARPAPTSWRQRKATPDEPIVVVNGQARPGWSGIASDAFGAAVKF